MIGSIILPNFSSFWSSIGKYLILRLVSWRHQSVKTMPLENCFSWHFPPIIVSRICPLQVSNALTNTQEGGPAKLWRSAQKTFCRKLDIKLNTCDAIATSKTSFKGQQSKYKLTNILYDKVMKWHYYHDCGSLQT